jgi:hypothetical protein
MVFTIAPVFEEQKGLPIAPAVRIYRSSTTFPLEENVWTSASQDVVKLTDEPTVTTTFRSILWPDQLVLLRHCVFKFRDGSRLAETNDNLLEGEKGQLNI